MRDHHQPVGQSVRNVIHTGVGGPRGPHPRLQPARHGAASLTASRPAGMP